MGQRQMNVNGMATDDRVMRDDDNKDDDSEVPLRDCGLMASSAINLMCSDLNKFLSPLFKAFKWQSQPPLPFVPPNVLSNRIQKPDCRPHITGF
ncbi:hypothetical protein OROMI_025484 [Orobanche minor]